MSLAMLVGGEKTAATTPAPATGLAPNAFQNQMYGPNATVPVRTGPIDFSASSLASQLPVGLGKVASTAPAAQTAAPAAPQYPTGGGFDGPFAQFFRALYDKNPEFYNRMQTPEFKQRAADNTR